MDYLSPDWLRAAADAVSAVPAPPDASAVIAQRVPDAPDGPVEYRLVIAEGSCRLVVGLEPEAGVTLVTPLAVAASITTGRASAQEAFLHGAIRLAGDPAVLLAHRGMAAALADAIGSVPTDVPRPPGPTGPPTGPR